MDEQNLDDRLEALRRERGYLLPHHGLMAACMPELLEAYDRLYRLLTSAEGELDKIQHESIWLGILASRDEQYGSHHVSHFLKAGGSPSELQAILAITALARGSAAHVFADAHWSQYLNEFDSASVYIDSFRSISQELPTPLAHLISIAALTCLRNPTVLSWQIQAAYTDGVSEVSIAESLAMTMFPGSVPNFVAATAVWQRLITDEVIDASPEFRAWARFAGQGGWQEAFESI